MNIIIVNDFNSGTIGVGTMLSPQSTVAMASIAQTQSLLPYITKIIVVLFALLAFLNTSFRLLLMVGNAMTFSAVVNVGCTVIGGRTGRTVPLLSCRSGSVPRNTFRPSSDNPSYILEPLSASPLTQCIVFASRPDHFQLVSCLSPAYYTHWRCIPFAPRRKGAVLGPYHGQGGEKARGVSSLESK